MSNIPHEASTVANVHANEDGSKVAGLIDIIEPVEPSWFLPWEFFGLMGAVVVITGWIWWKLQSNPHFRWWRWLHQQQVGLKQLSHPATSISPQQWLWQGASELENWKQVLVNHDLVMSAKTLELIEVWQSIAFQAPLSKTQMNNQFSRENLSQLIFELQQQARSQLLEAIKVKLFYRPVKKLQEQVWKR